ncbi:hypothetical protein GCM10023063_38760 [Arthrobacter methylotrophus]|uniref:hypothetical protein n=1 Tax=Arthrobacter methylotrophus TaxID=121291 RepID=UPI0031F0FD81
MSRCECEWLGDCSCELSPVLPTTPAKACKVRLKSEGSGVTCPMRSGEPHVYDWPGWDQHRDACYHCGEPRPQTEKGRGAPVKESATADEPTTTK